MYFYFIKKLITCTTDICINMPNKSNNVRLIQDNFFGYYLQKYAYS